MVGTLINRLPACAWLTGITTTLRERPLPTPAVRASNCCFKHPKPIQQGDLSQLEGRFLLDLSAIGNVMFSASSEWLRGMQVNNKQQSSKSSLNWRASGRITLGLLGK